MNWTGMEAAEKIKGRAPKDLLRLHREFTRLFWWWGLFFFWLVCISSYSTPHMCFVCNEKKCSKYLQKCESQCLAHGRVSVSFGFCPLASASCGERQSGRRVFLGGR